MSYAYLVEPIERGWKPGIVHLVEVPCWECSGSGQWGSRASAHVCEFCGGGRFVAVAKGSKRDKGGEA